MTELLSAGEVQHPCGWAFAFPFVKRVPPAKLVRLLGTATLLDRIRENDPTLRSVRLDYELLPREEIMQALLGNNTISSVVIARVIPRNSTGTDFARFLESLYHLPLRSVQVQDGEKLPSSYLNHLLYLVEYCSGVGKACKWTDGKCYAGADLNTGNTTTEINDAEEFNGNNSREDVDSEVLDYKRGAVLEFVDFSGCRLTVRQAQWLGDILFHRRCTLRHVNACECRLGNGGVRALLRRVSTSPRLKAASIAEGSVVPLDMIELRWNGVTEDESIRNFVDVVERSPDCWTCMTVYGNYISPHMYTRCEAQVVKAKRLMEEERLKRREIPTNVEVTQPDGRLSSEKGTSCSPRRYFVDLLTSVAGEVDFVCPSLRAVSSLLHEEP